MFSGPAGGLRNVRIFSPGAVPVGESVLLECQFDLEGDRLYAVKWYQGKREFYRYLPNDAPPTRVFPLPGVTVDLSQSGPRQVTLSDAHFGLSGRYRCEVSADAPSFDTALVMAELHVVDLPDEPPLVVVERATYAVGEVVRANCTARRSHPPANLTWVVNGRQVRSGRYVKRYPPVQEDDNVTSTTLGLEVETHSGSFRSGKLTLRCQAAMFDVYNRSSDVIVEEERPRLASILGSRDSNGCSKVLHVSWPLLLAALLALLRQH